MISKIKNLFVTPFLFFLIASLFIFPTANYAESRSQPQSPPNTGFLSENPNNVVTDDTGIRSTEYIKFYDVSIIKSSPGLVEVKGTTESYDTVDTIGLKLYLQYWDQTDQKWKDATFVGEFKNTNSTYVLGSGKVKVSPGYYYRTRGVHYVNENGWSEQLNSYSAYIYIE